MSFVAKRAEVLRCDVVLIHSSQLSAPVYVPCYTQMQFF